MRGINLLSSGGRSSRVITYGGTGLFLRGNGPRLPAGFAYLRVQTAPGVHARLRVQSAPGIHARLIVRQS